MPFFPVIETSSRLGGLSPPRDGPIPPSKVPVSARWKTPGTPPSGGPNMGAVWQLNSFYLPIVLWIVHSGAPPTVAHFAPQLYVSSDLAWQSSLDMEITTLDVYAGTVAAFALVAEALPTQIAYRNGQTFQFGYIVSFDDTTSIVSVDVMLGAQLDPGGGIPVPAAASVGYLEQFDPSAVAGMAVA